MLKERNARIAAFQKISGYLFWLYWPIAFFLACFLVGVLVTAVISKSGDVSLIEFLIKLSAPNADFFDTYFNTALSLTTKLVSTTTMMILMAMGIYLLFHFTRMLECFNGGNIFSRTAVYHARKAYKMNLLIGFFVYGTELVVVVLSFVYADSGNGHRLWELLGNLLNFAIEIGILSLILWALEMGTDLSEESELTI